MNTPWTLRLALAWAAIRSEFISISVDARPDSGTHYRFDVRPQSVRSWLRRRERLNARLQQARHDERAQILARLRVIASGAVLDPDGANQALADEVTHLAVSLTKDRDR